MRTRGKYFLLTTNTNHELNLSSWPRMCPAWPPSSRDGMRTRAAWTRASSSWTVCRRGSSRTAPRTNARPGKDSPTVKHGVNKTVAKLSSKEANAATSRRSTRRITIQRLTCEHPRMCCRMARTTLPHSVQRCFPPSVWTEFSEIRADKPRTGERMETKNIHKIQLYFLNLFPTFDKMDKW